MRATLVFLIIPLSMVVYLVLATKFGIYQRYPVINLLLALGSLVALFIITRKRFSYYRLALNLVGWALFLFFGYWTLIFSEYKDAPPQVSEYQTITAQLTAVTLETEKGEALPASRLLQDASGKNTLLVFFRGHW
ncbi:MAG: hypothetical protein QNK37_36810 [Acidobacteriota bacterium]|nr:hypothetical protein [Acidobacteriota bacterium]